MKTPARTTARAFCRYLSGEVLADSVALGWTGLYVRLCRMPRAVDAFRATLAAAWPILSFTLPIGR